MGNTQLQSIYSLSSFYVLLLVFSLYRWHQKLQSTDIYIKSPIYMRIYQKSTNIFLSLVKYFLFFIFVHNLWISIISLNLFFLVWLLVLIFLDISYFIGGSWGYNKIKNKLKMKIVVIYKLILIAIKADISKIIYFLTYCQIAVLLYLLLLIFL